MLPEFGIRKIKKYLQKKVIIRMFKVLKIKYINRIITYEFERASYGYFCKSR
ncbi:hypothetical protein CCAN11_2330001 [Capnocytophaga canimorsus]|uniref:Uncharacterized protein n=1 Tax=Capnocytophaga canimorsus TaxID=28188 RepID=A0A0B7II75_9FLAO|nr:hypothetical protein CCAN11_2330001 [Capnocytophaga canimorsus]